MTDRLREIEDRCEKATPGPWEYVTIPATLSDLARKDFPRGIGLTNTWIQTSWIQGQLKDKMPIIYPTMSPYTIPEHCIDVEVQDADFIAHAREDIPYLLSVIKEQAEEIERLKSYFSAPTVFGSAYSEDAKPLDGTVQE